MSKITQYVLSRWMGFLLADNAYSGLHSQNRFEGSLNANVHVSEVCAYIIKE